MRRRRSHSPKVRNIYDWVVPALSSLLDVDYEEPPPLPKPRGTRCLPGTPGKVQELRRRYLLRQNLWSVEDAKLSELVDGRLGLLLGTASNFAGVRAGLEAAGGLQEGSVRPGLVSQEAGGLQRCRDDGCAAAGMVVPAGRERDPMGRVTIRWEEQPGGPALVG
jgi:hypothetical protein